MARAYTPKVLTANRLIEGDVVYLNASGEWVLFHDQAWLIEDEAVANTELAKALKLADLLVGPYLANAEMKDGTPIPTHFREEFRTKGPSNYIHGKQEAQ
ncbi:hypothetical protein GCM10007939_03940 [Amylibacter marinus]|uniref:DUF2849 domain-containing protein n=1 Tax=Amylibacter marinus TaxID=1475483 RepID=A0ABQ5VRS6_9RHOB|nr:DUF2849 domain-containing protein [Amylibacter marinus]GLQ34111.1 hypothetical protein GCM10007939_03940 [Amylibacter marinus]